MFSKPLLLAAAIMSLAGPALADEICSDRPAKATGTCTVKQGHWLVSDNALVSTFDNGGTTTDQYLIVAPTIKYGLTHRIDLEAYMPVLENVTSKSANGKTDVTGNGDLTLRAKYKIVYTGPFEFGIEPFVKAPVGLLD